MGLETLKDQWPLDYWQSKEFLDVQDKLDRLEEDCIPYNPPRSDLFRALELTRLDSVNVAIIGQDPYPDPRYATGVAFSSQRGLKAEEFTIPSPIRAVSSIPSSLHTIYREYNRDLSLPFPSHGCLEGWCDQGVLLWNATPTIEIKRSGYVWESYTHRFWPEWPPLTQEIIERLSAKGCGVFAFLGSKAREYSKYVDTGDGYNTTLFYTHPSPLAQANTNRPFVGSRFFTTINNTLLHYCKEPIDWRLE